MLVDLSMSLHVKNSAHMIRFCTLGRKIKLFPPKTPIQL